MRLDFWGVSRTWGVLFADSRFWDAVALLLLSLQLLPRSLL